MTTRRGPATAQPPREAPDPAGRQEQSRRACSTAPEGPAPPFEHLPSVVRLARITSARQAPILGRSPWRADPVPPIVAGETCVARWFGLVGIRRPPDPPALSRTRDDRLETLPPLEGGPADAGVLDDIAGCPSALDG